MSQSTSVQESQGTGWGILNWMFGSNQEQEPVKEKGELPTEAHRLCERFIPENVTQFLKDYPLTSLVATVALAFFGLMNIFSFSPTNILTGAFHLTLSYSLTKGIWRKGPLEHLVAVQHSIQEMMEYRSKLSEEKAAERSSALSSS